MNPDTSATIDALASRLAQVRKSKSGEELLLVTIEQVIISAGPREAEVLRRCAIPRWVDISVLRVLRESEAGNERVLDLLREYSFVRDLGDGRVAYHDEVRHALLEEWKRDRPDEARAIHRRLYSYFSTRTTPPGLANRAMPLMPDSTSLSVVPMTAQSDLLRREALYHLLHLDLERGLPELRSTFEALEEAHRLAEAELLVQMASETPLGPRERRWAQYMRACVLQAALRLEEAITQLDALKARGDLEPDLLAEVSRTLGEIYSETGQWSRATELYGQSLAHYTRVNNQRAIAETRLLLGEAYQGLGVSAGSWYAPSAPSNPLLRLAQATWVWVLGLPFQIAILLMGPRNRLLPRPAYCARYQNWLLIRLYNTARTWYALADEAFRRLDDQAGLLRTEQRLADILLLYGYHDEAQAAIEELLGRPAARDPYRRAWLQRSLAECRLAAGDHASAHALLAEARAIFKELGDVRREATVLTLQGRAAAAAGAFEAALRSYEAGLQRFRALRYAAARERILHELRTWQRRPDIDAAARARFAALVAAEPVKQYVGRFIRSYQGHLQVIAMLAPLLTLLLMAMVAPVARVSLTEGGVFNLGVFFSPMRVLGVLATLAPIYMAMYAAIATAVIYWLPINRIERERPDMVVTSPTSIARYDHRGALELELSWAEIRQWLTLDRCLWRRPLSLYSRTYLEDRAGRDLAIDGMTGWYTELQADIGQRLGAAGVTVARRDLGYSLLRSWAGLSAAVGAVLLLAVIWSNNGWLNLDALFSPGVTAAIWFLALSGALILIPVAYWVANRPLKVQRALVLNERWPVVLAVIGGLTVGAYLLTGGRGISVTALSYSTFVWGCYVLAEALVAILAPGRRPLRLAVVAAATLLGLAVVARPALAHYHWIESYVARRQVANGVMTSTPSCDAASQARALGADPFSTWALQGDCAAATGTWGPAASSYAQAAESARPGSGEQALAYYNLSVAAAQADDRALAASADDAYRQLCTRSPAARLMCDQMFSQRKP